MIKGPSQITVIIPTYNRPKVLMRTISYIRSNLIFDGVVHIAVGNDGDDLPYSNYDAVIREGPKRGLGANLNFLMDLVETEVVLQMDDDHWLVEPLDINRYVNDLFNPELNIGWVRLFMGEPEDTYNLKSYYKFQAANYGPYWYISPDSPDLYIASNRPHIKKTIFHQRFYGLYREDLTLGKTEENFCHLYKSKRKSLVWAALPWIVIPMFGLGHGQWAHVGESWQKEGF